MFNFIRMKQPLRYDVISDGIVVIPKGTTDVEIAYRQSNKTYRTKDNKLVNRNVYRYNDKIYHA